MLKEFHENIKVSVVIPAYNAALTIETTLNSVLSQTVPPHEILVWDDGSTDATAEILEFYKSCITVFRQANRGVAYTRNALCERAQGDIIAFLDADDVWHPNYLKMQHKMFEDFPNAVAYFTEHANFFGYGNYQWKTSYVDSHIKSELITPVNFVKRYVKTPMSFQMSCCCIPRKVLAEIGGEPFCISGAEDTYLHNLIPLCGPIAYISEPLVAYRITESSLSTNRLKNSLLIIDAFQLLEERYKKVNNSDLYCAFKIAFASRKRGCGKFLMGAGQLLEARKQIRNSINITVNPVSILKSLALLLLTYMPATMQPRWPASYRESCEPRDH